jgi:hypothetical protein
MSARLTVWFALACLIPACGPGLTLRPAESPSPDAGMPPAPDALGDRSLACPLEAHCWSFEDDPVDAPPQPPWVAVPGVDLQGRQPRVAIGIRIPGEGKAVHATGIGQSFAAFSLDVDSVAPGLGSAYYGRMMIWLETAPADDWRMIEVSTTDGPEACAYGGHGTTWAAEYTASGDVDCDRRSAQELPTGAWTCIEWHVVGPSTSDPAAGQMALWIDGCAAPDMNIARSSSSTCDDAEVHSWRVPPPRILRIGVVSYVDSPVAFSMWIDDVALSRARVGCPGATPRCP